MPHRRPPILCLDEAGGIGPFPIAVFALLLINEPHAVLEAVNQVRRQYGFVNELKSSKWSNLRRRVYVDVLTEVIKYDVRATMLVVQKHDLDRRYFAGKDYLAYNYLAKQLVVRATVGVQGATLYVDKKQRTRRDNFLEYLKAEINLRALEDGRPVVLQGVEDVDSKAFELMQITDLFAGTVYGIETGNVKKMELFEIILPKTEIWRWRPQKRRHARHPTSGLRRT
jgi:hypothetical protein